MHKTARILWGAVLLCILAGCCVYCILQGEELHGAKKVLGAAAMTYVAAAAGMVLQLLRLILLFGGRGRRDSK